MASKLMGEVGKRLHMQKINFGWERGKGIANETEEVVLLKKERTGKNNEMVKGRCGPW